MHLQTLHEREWSDTYQKQSPGQCRGFANADVIQIYLASSTSTAVYICRFSSNCFSVMNSCSEWPV